MTASNLLKTLCDFWKRRMTAFVLLLILFATGIFHLCDINVRETLEPTYRDNYVIVGEILDGVRIRQTLETDKPVKNVSVRFATFARKNHGKIRFYLKDDTSGKVLYETALEMESLTDNQNRRISFHKPVKCERGHRIAFYLEGTPDCRRGNAVTCRARASDHPGYWKNGVPAKATLIFKASLRYKRARVFPLWWYVLGGLTVLFLFLPADSKFWETRFGIFWKRRIFAAVLTAVLLLLAAAMTDGRGDIGHWAVMTAFAAVFMLALKDDFLLNAVKSPEKIFLVVGGLSILAIFYFTPLLDGEDATNHLVRIYQISEGKILFRPGPAEAMSRDEMDWGGVQHRHAKEVWTGDRLCFSSRTATMKARPFHAETMNRKHYLMGYTPLAYLPYIGVVYYARKAGLSLAAGLTLLYTVSALVYLTAMYLMIRAIPVFKWPLTIFALTPAVIYHGMSYSADAFLILCASFFFMLVMRLREVQRPYTRLQLLLLAAVAIALCQCKFVYFPLLGMMFLLPAENFGSRKRHWAFSVVTIAAAVFLGWLWNKVSTDYSTLLNLDKQSTADKMAFVVRHPWKFFMLWVDTQFPKKLPITLCSAFDSLGTRDLFAKHGDGRLFPCLFSGFAPLCCAAYLLTFCFIRERALKLWKRLALVVLALWAVGMIYVAIFCINTITNGIQGRYLIPLFPLLFLVFGQNKFGLSEKYLPYYKGFLVIFLASVQILTADALRQAYWM